MRSGDESRVIGLAGCLRSGLQSTLLMESLLVCVASSADVLVSTLKFVALATLLSNHMKEIQADYCNWRFMYSFLKASLLLSLQTYQYKGFII